MRPHNTPAEYYFTCSGPHYASYLSLSSKQELRAVFSPQIPNTALPHLWSTISHALGGIFCASLHFVARPESTALQAITAELVTPVTDTSETNKSDTYNNVTNVSNGLWRPGAAREHVLSAALPQEASCTENLTPWLKLLPCR